jgi:hypothetical protein
MGTPDLRSPQLHQLERVAGTESPLQRAESPAPPPLEAEADWSFARREAVMARLAGQNVDLAALTDTDLDQLYADLTKARASRRAGTASVVSGRESRMSSFAGDEDDDEGGSSGSAPSGRPFSSSTWTDDTSLQEATLILAGSATMPEALRHIKEELEGQLEAQRVAYEEKLRVMATPVEEVQEEKREMEQKLQLVQSEMQVRAYTLPSHPQLSYECSICWMSSDECAVRLILGRLYADSYTALRDQGAAASSAIRSAWPPRLAPVVRRACRRRSARSRTLAIANAHQDGRKRSHLGRRH